MSAPPAGPSAPATRVADLPGLRAFRSPRFRLVLAAMLLVLGSIAWVGLLAGQAGQPLERGQFGIDLADYLQAAQRIEQGHSPYAPEMLAGPVDAQGRDRYRYPPPLAQLLVPFAAVPLTVAAAAWAAVQALCVFLATWLAGTHGGAARSVERLLWTGVAVVLFMPAFDAAWKGNVSGSLALLVALVAAGGRTGAAAAAGATLLKTTSAPLLVPVLLAGRNAALSAIGAGVAITALSILVSPGAWLEYPLVLGNMLLGSAAYPSNLAPAALAAAHLGADPALASAVRGLTLALAISLLVLAVVLARRRANEAAVIAAVAAMLLLPAALWLHYLVVLLPISAVAWARAARPLRVLMVTGCAAASLAVAWLPLGLAGAVVVLGAAGAALARRSGG